MTIKQIVTYVSSGVFALALITVGLNSWTVVDAGEEKTVSLFGKLSDTVLTEGFHIVNPLADLDSYSIQDHTLELQQVEVPAQDKLKSTMDVSITLHLQPGVAPSVKRHAGSLQAAVDKWVTPKVRSAMREVGKSVQASQDFFLDSTQKDMEIGMLTQLNDYLNPKGFTVSAVMFRDIDLPTVVREAIVQTKSREEKINQERAQLEITALEQAKQIKVSEAKEKAAIAESAAIKTMADAKAYQITAEATAQAKANKALNESVTPELVDYIRANNWNGILPTTVMGDAIPMIQVK